MSHAIVEIDVTDAVPFAEPQRVSTWVFAPKAPAARVPLLFCLPGGSYTKAYWHLEVPGRPDYSFAEHFAARGMLVVAVDHLGTGESTPHERAIDLTPDVVAAANAATFMEIVDRARRGTLLPDVGPMTIGPTVGVGHSMGAMLAVFQQSAHGSFDAIAPLGYGTIGPIIDLGEGIPLPTSESLMAAAREGLLDGLPPLDRETMRHHFYWDDVPRDVIAADDLTLTNAPGVCGSLSIVPFIASDHARRVACPVFIGLGEPDSTFDHHDEARAYASSSDVTLFILERSAHCHNSAGTRHVLWDRLAGWVTALASPNRPHGT
jgi:pimeloyl-ACP methyl ester carboxylesterase